jgi:hypothetical protein
MATINRKFVFNKETKGSVQFQEVDENGKKLEMQDDGCAIGALYMRKKALGGKIPTQILVSIEV